MNIEKKDIMKIGHTAYHNEEGMLCIITAIQTANIEEILLREILRCFGDYKIIDSMDSWWNGHEEDAPDIKFITNLPWEIYMELSKEEKLG